MAAKIFGLPMPKYKKGDPDEAAKSKYRYPIKRLNFGIAYLIGAKGLSNQILEYIADLEMEGEPVEIEPWDEKTCEKFINEWYKLNPEVKDFQMAMAAMARRYGYVKDKFGRMRYIPEVSCPIKSIQEAGLRQAANMPVTATATGIIKISMGQLWRDLPKTEWSKHVKFLLQIHDSLLIEITDDESVYKPYARWMEKIMTSVVSLKVPVGVDFKIGRQWGATKGLDVQN
jgi:DNA polymerase-1